MKTQLTAARLRGIYTAIPTPVTADDRIDEGAARTLVSQLVRQGVDGIVPLGGTGEYGALAREERTRMAALTAQTVDGRIPVVAGGLDTVLPRTWRALHALCVAGRIAEALAMHRELMPLLDLAFGETNPGPLKSVWDLIGVHAPHVLAPLVPAAEDLTRRLRAELAIRLRAEAAFD